MTNVLIFGEIATQKYVKYPIFKLCACGVYNGLLSNFQGGCPRGRSSKSWKNFFAQLDGGGPEVPSQATCCAHANLHGCAKI